MNISRGKIGMQETVSLLGIALAIGVIFTVNTEKLFAEGNSSYISLPLSVLLSFCSVFPILIGIRDSKREDLHDFLVFLYGRPGAFIAGFFLSAFFLFSAFSVLTKFSDILHSFSYVHSEHRNIALWILFSVVLLALGGIERLGRSAKCLCLGLLAVLLFVLFLPMKSYSLHRLYPLPGKGAGDILLESVRHCLYSLPVFLCSLVNLQGLHGAESTKRSLVISCGFSAVLIFLTQLCTGLSFHSIELQNLYIPIFRLDTILLKENYFMRLDKLLLFISLPGAILTGAYYLDAAVLLQAENWKASRLIPGILSSGLFLLIWIDLAFVRHDSFFRQILSFMENWGSFLLFPFCFFSGLFGTLKSRKKIRASV